MPESRWEDIARTPRFGAIMCYRNYPKITGLPWPLWKPAEKELLSRHMGTFLSPLLRAPFSVWWNQWIPSLTGAVSRGAILRRQRTTNGNRFGGGQPFVPLLKLIASHAKSYSLQYDNWRIVNPFLECSQWTLLYLASLGNFSHGSCQDIRRCCLDSSYSFSFCYCWFFCFAFFSQNEMCIAKFLGAKVSRSIFLCSLG